MVTSVLQPGTVEELSEAVASVSCVRIVGSDSQRGFRLPGDKSDVLSLERLSGVLDFSPADQVVTVLAGTSLADLQSVLAAHGQCLPVDTKGTVGGALSLNLPVPGEGLYGSWRDRLLGLTVVLADGTLAKAGSKVVKNVAGYDIHKLLVGARGTLGVIASVTLRTTSTPPAVSHSVPEGTNWIQRTLAKDFGALDAAASDYPGLADEGTSTQWRQLPNGVELPRFPGDWVLRSGQGTSNLDDFVGVQARFMLRAKGLLDPGRKLNPGEMGLF